MVHQADFNGFEPLENNGESNGREPNPWSTSLSGCGYLLVIMLLTTGMLILNAVVCLSAHSAFMTFGPKFLVENPTLAPYVGQLFFFTVPILLTVIQWNLFDRLNRIFRRQ